MSHPKSSLVIVYHRQPYEEITGPDGTVEYRPNKSPNGIVPTLKSFFGSVDHGAWVAWKAAEDPDTADWPRRVTIDDEHGSYDVVRLPLTPKQVRSFYHVTSKEAFWPILHSFPWQFSAKNVDWDTFVEVNRRFAEAACAQAADDALIWVHDYNLWLVPGFVRQMKPKARIAFFHHTPFPAPDIFNIIPWREEIIDSLLACDVVGFHVPRYANNFQQVVEGLREVHSHPKVRVDPQMTPVGLALSDRECATAMVYKGQTVHIDVWPVGTNPDLIKGLLSTEEAKARLAHIKEELDGRKLIVSIGRIDYTKGTQAMLQAYARLLDRRPDLHEQVKLMVTAVEAARGMQVYMEAQREIEGLVGRINGRYGTLGWTPVMLCTHSLPFEEVICYYKAADVCWTTPLRDGLNLVAKEYVAAHEEDGDGALVLSEFTGVSVEMAKAVMVNPYSEDDMDRAIEEALGMERPERRRRLSAMAENVATYDIDHWAEHVMAIFDGLKPSPSGPVAAVPLQMEESLRHRFV